MENLAKATLAEVLQDFLAVYGLGFIKIKPLGAKEVLLEFQSKEEILDILREVHDFLLHKFLSVKPCTQHTSSQSHLFWVRLRNIPVYVWGYHFFKVVISTMENLICLDGPMVAKTRFNMAPVLVESLTPTIVNCEVPVVVDGVAVKVLLKPEYETTNGRRQQWLSQDQHALFLRIRHWRRRRVGHRCMGVGRTKCWIALVSYLRSSVGRRKLQQTFCRR